MTQKQGRDSLKDSRSRHCWKLISRLVMGGTIVVLPLSAIVQGTRLANAQLRPIADDTLGNERAIVSPNRVINNLPSNQIDGGARRGANLFHSFRDFNIDVGRGAYFTNPTGVTNILTRVTGSKPSQILGTLGVLGNANLFLLNPNGILFGQNAQLDIRGSFLASTANSFKFPDGSEFSAINPQAPPLLSINVSLGLQTGVIPANGAITNRGNLAAGQDLTLEGDQLDLQGQLVAGRDLTLKAQDTVQIRDTITTPFLAQSGRDLSVQGNQGVDILALNHPSTPFQSGRNLSLISDGVISGDAHFRSGGEFQIRSVSGQPATFMSLYDPIISSAGNVDLAAAYTGASLLIESQGSVRIQGAVTITAPDAVSNFVGSDAVLATQPGLIIRSGQTSLVYGGTNQNNPLAFTNGTLPAGITLDKPVRVQPNAAGGIVKLNADNGGITFSSIDASSITGGKGGDIALTAQGDIHNTGSFIDSLDDSVALASLSYSATGNAGDGGNITLTSTAGSIRLNSGGSESASGSIVGKSGDAGAIAFTTNSGNITLTNAYTYTYSDAGLGSGNAGNGGAIAFTTNSGNITLTNSDSNSSSGSGTGTGNAGSGGAISFATNSGNISLNNSNSGSYSTSSSSTGNAGNGGAISFSTNTGNITLTNSRSSSRSSSSSLSGNMGNGGAIAFATKSGNITLNTSYASANGGANGGVIAFATNSGNITLNSSPLGSGGRTNGGVIAFATNSGNITLTSSFSDTESYSALGNAGNGGVISLSTNSGSINLDGSPLLANSSSSLGSRNGGVIAFATNSGNITVSKDSYLQSNSSSGSGNAGNGGAISLSTNSGNITFETSYVNSDSSSGSGNAGNGGAISLSTNSGNITFINNLRQLYNETLSYSNLNSNSSSVSGNAGNGGTITLSAKGGAIAGGASTLNSSAISQRGVSGNSGTVILEAGSSISRVTVSTVASGGTAGDVQINGFSNLLISDVNIQTAQKLQICQSPPCSNTLFIQVPLTGRGQAGNVTVGSIGNLTFSNSVIQSDTLSGKPAGNITITSPGVASFNNSQITSNTSGIGNAGDIAINAPLVNLTAQSQIQAQTTTESSGKGGSITITAPTAVNLTRTADGNPVISVKTNGAGKPGDITINTPQLTLSDAAEITATATATATNPQGGGSVTLNASHLNLAGIVGVFAETQGQAPAGTLRLNPYNNQPDLEIALAPNSQISASTSGSGKGGDLIVTAPQSITIAGAGKLAVETSSTGNAGDISIATQQLTLKDGVEISASTSSSGKAGEIDINAETFTLSGGAKVSTNTSSSGAAGDLTVQVSDRLFLTGQATGLFASTALGSTGNGGNITIDPRLVQIEDGAAIAVNSQGRGTGGNISLQADRVTLNRQGSITAETASAQGGNISLDVKDILLLRRNSLISATAGTAQAGGDGGNITFNGKFIVAVPNENSDISANAFTGNGGRVQINAQGLFGIQFRPQLTPLSDITASSTFGFAGVVTINTPNVDPNRGLVQLPVDLTDASRLIVQNCPTGDSLAKPPNEFVVTGRGGLPPTPSEAMNRDAIQVDLVTADAGDSPAVSQNQPSPTSPSPHLPTPQLPHQAIVEAQQLQIASDGTVYLGAAVLTSPIDHFRDRLIHCR